MTHAVKDNEFAQNLRRLRARSQNGVRVVATECGISAATLSRVENGGMPDLRTFRNICEWMGWSYNYGIEAVFNERKSR